MTLAQLNTAGTTAILVATIVTSFLAFTRHNLEERMIFDIQAILRDKQWYRLVSSGFIHADFMHLAFNMYTLYSFGQPVEFALGTIHFLIIYFASIIGGGLISLWLHRHHEYRALGASGGVCGIIFACMFIFPNGSIEMYLIPVPVPAWLYAIGFMLISYYGIRSQRDNIGHDSHLGGAITGLGTLTAIRPLIIVDNPILYPTVAVLAVILFVLLYRHSLHAFAGASPFSLVSIKAWFQQRRRPGNTADDEAMLEKLLDKISQKGLDALSRSERKKLSDISTRKNVAEIDRYNR